MEENAPAAVVLRYRDGRTDRGTALPEIDIAQQFVRLSGADISFDELKAVFFPKGALSREDDASARSSIVSVEFDDGEIIRGRAYDYNPLAPGFYLLPEEEPRIDRIFVVSAAVVAIEVEKL
jgi:hypothetical protein